MKASRSSRKRASFPPRQQEFRAVRRLVARAGAERLAVWFLIIHAPIALALSALFGWHNSAVGEPTALHMALRTVIALFAFSLGLSLFVLKVRRMARRPASARAEHGPDRERHGDAGEQAPPAAGPADGTLVEEG